MPEDIASIRAASATRLPDALATWASGTSGGDPSLLAAITCALERFRSRTSCVAVASPAPSYSGFVRCYRAAAVLRSDGLVRSTEMLSVPDIESFRRNPEERAGVFGSAHWDDFATLFIERQPPRLVSGRASILDHSGVAVLSTVQDQVRLFEFFLGNDLADRGIAGLSNDWRDMQSMSFSLRGSLRDSLAETLEAVIRDEAPRAISAFRAMLDPAKLDLLAKAGANGVQPHNWLAGSERGKLREGLSLRRQQAATAYPITFSILSKPGSPVGDAISSGAPLVPALAKAANVGERAIKLLNGVQASALGFEGTPDQRFILDTVRKLEAMPQVPRPKTERGWQAYFAAHAMALTYEKTTAIETDGVPGSKLLGTFGGLWDDLDPERMFLAARGMRDAIGDFHSNVAFPAAVMAGQADWTRVQTAKAIYGGRSLQQIADASLWWHGHQARIRAALSAEHPLEPDAARPSAWAPLHHGDPWAGPSNTHLRCLVNQDDLDQEHEMLGHCVNTYAEHCYRGSHIISVRTKSGQSLATAEFFQPDLLALIRATSALPDAAVTSLPPCVIQFQGKDNAVPPENAWVALWSYTQALIEGTPKVDCDGLEAALNTRLVVLGDSGVEDMGHAACYNALSRPALLDAWRRYETLLPKSVAKRGPFKLVKPTA